MSYWLKMTRVVVKYIGTYVHCRLTSLGMSHSYVRNIDTETYVGVCLGTLKRYRIAGRGVEFKLPPSIENLYHGT